MAARSQASGWKGTLPLWMCTVQPLPWAISKPWPSRAKPVTSVQLWTRYFTMMSRAVRFRAAIWR